jgi:hypothetical protein
MPDILIWIFLRKAWIQLLPFRKYFNLYFAAIRGNRIETLRGQVK